MTRQLTNNNQCEKSCNWALCARALALDSHAIAQNSKISLCRKFVHSLWFFFLRSVFIHSLRCLFMIRGLYRCNAYIYMKKRAMISDQLSTQFFILNIFRASVLPSTAFFSRCLALHPTDQIIVVQFYTITLRWLDYKIIIFISFFRSDFNSLDIFVTVSGSNHFMMQRL